MKALKKIVLITGANRGIGLSTSKKFLEEGYLVILTARNVEFGKVAIDKLGNEEDLIFCPLDISDVESVENVKEYIENRFGRLDVLINNAAINYDNWQNALNADLNQVIETINVNVIGAWRMAQVFIPLMQKNDYGRIINISSELGSFNRMGIETPAYSISKASLNALTVMLANTLGSGNVYINSLCPGWVKTDMGGVNGVRMPQDAAEDIFWLANNDHLNGKFIKNKEIIDF